MPAVFERYVVVDWSASSVPVTGRDSIWSCAHEPASGRLDLHNHGTRAAARAHLEHLLLAARGRTLVGFDFAFGFPRGFARAAGLDDGRPSWQATWSALSQRVLDTSTNENNRFAVAASLNAAISSGPGPFWGTTSARHTTPHLSRVKSPGFPHGGLAELRVTELAMRATGRRPSSVWQLAGVGSVGSQTLTGIPVVHGLRTHPGLATRSRVWPFETGFDGVPLTGPDTIVHAEVWPSAIPLESGLHDVHDAAQVIGLCRHLARLDVAGELARQFRPVLDPVTAAAVIDEEGWILGTPQTHRAGRTPA